MSRRWQESSAHCVRPQTDLTRRGFTVHLPQAEAGETKLLVRRDRIEVKVEVNFVTRWYRSSRASRVIHGLRHAMRCSRMRKSRWFRSRTCTGASSCAALERQHPRDLFDVMQLYQNEGITPGIRRAFVVYAACGKRPIHELLFPQLRDIRHDYTHNFQGMTTEPVPLDALIAARERLVKQIPIGTG